MMLDICCLGRCFVYAEFVTKRKWCDLKGLVELTTVGDVKGPRLGIDTGMPSYEVCSKQISMHIDREWCLYTPKDTDWSRRKSKYWGKHIWWSERHILISQHTPKCFNWESFMWTKTDKHGMPVTIFFSHQKKIFGMDSWDDMIIVLWVLSSKKSRMCIGSISNVVFGTKSLGIGEWEHDWVNTE